MPTELPSFVQRGGMQIFPQPWAIRRGDYWGFLLEADEAAMQASICDRLFNDPMGQPGRFVPAGPFTMLVFNDLRQLVSAAPGWEGRGVMHEHEAAFWTLVQDTQGDRLLWTQTYMIVDRGRAVSTGRETFGFPKEYGWIETPQDARDPAHFAIDTIVVPEFGSGDLECRERLVTVTRTGKGDAARELGAGLWGALRTGWDVLRHSGGLLGAARTVLHGLEDGVEMTVPMVFLKQFPDVADPSRCCYQAVTEARTVLNTLHSGLVFFDKFDIEIGNWASHDIVGDFGLAGGVQAPTIGFWVNMDFTVEPGREIWRAAGT